MRRILLVTAAAGGITFGVLAQTRPARANAGGYQYAEDINGMGYCGGLCRAAPCCKIVPL